MVAQGDSSKGHFRILPGARLPVKALAYRLKFPEIGQHTKRMQTPLGIPYGIEVTDYVEQYVRDANQITCVLSVDWPDVADWKREMLGYTEAHPEGLATIFYRTPPVLCPLTANMRCMSLTLVKYGGTGKNSEPYGRALPGVVNPSTGLPYPGFAVDSIYPDPDYDEDKQTKGWFTTDKAYYRAVFTRPPWKYTKTDAETQSSSLKELCRYVKWKDSWNARERRRPDFGFVTDDADQSPVGIVGFEPDIEIEYVCTWYQIPIANIPRTTISDALLKVNSTELDIGDNRKFDAGTFLFKGVRRLDDVYESAGIGGQLYTDLEYIFGWRKLGWNRWKKKDGTVVGLKARGVAPPKAPYEAFDHKSLWTPG